LRYDLKTARILCIHTSDESRVLFLLIPDSRA